MFSSGKVGHATRLAGLSSSICLSGGSNIRGGLVLVLVYKGLH